MGKNAPSAGGGGGSAKVTSAGSSIGVAKAQEMLDIHNKMRCASGAPPLKWDPALAKQAESVNHGFHHSASYKLGIPCGENLYWSTNPSMTGAAKSWFDEYKAASS